MKIALNMGQSAPSTRDSQMKALERDILAAQRGDWNSKNSLARLFNPLLTSLAEKRTSDQPKINALVEAGRQGLYTAARKYKHSVGPERFQIYALDFIEKSMNHAQTHGFGRSGISSFFARLFGR